MAYFASVVMVEALVKVNRTDCVSCAVVIAWVVVSVTTVSPASLQYVTL